MWCTEVADGAFLAFSRVVSGDIGDHGRSLYLAASRLRSCLESQVRRHNGIVDTSNV